MQEAELKSIFVEACDVKGYTPDTAQFKLWKNLLLFADKRDVEGALQSWWEREHVFPSPSQLKPLVDVAKRLREAAVTDRYILARWQCPDCLTTCADYIKPEDHDTRRCMATGKSGSAGSRCYARMVQTERVDTREWGNVA